MELTSNSVVKAIIQQIRQHPGFENQKVYNERQEERLSRPCFFVQQINLTNAALLGNRYRRTYRINITWLPLKESSTPRNDCRSVGEELLGVFRYLRITEEEASEEIIARPSQIEFEIIDNELKFTLEVQIHALWVDESTPTMTELETDILTFERREN